MDPASDVLRQYTKGKGIDVSRRPFLIAPNATRHFSHADNFYSLKDIAIENADFILCDDLIQDTKYYPILIKEFFYALKKGGHLIIQYTPDELSFARLEKELFFLMKDSVDVVRTYIEGQRCTIVAKKMKSNPSKPEGVNSWSFGILTRGTTDNQVDEIIDSIKMQKIPRCEIIVCGKYAGKYRSKIVYIEFTERDDKGWITKKKNLMCEKAKYENLMIMHDRIKLHDGWFEGMKRYGNNFEILSIPTLQNGKRTYDWVSLKYPLEDPRAGWYLGGHLDYSDWDRWLYMDGGMIIMKKYVWQKVPWDESRYYAEAEDSKLSHDQARYGFIMRFNPFATCESFRFNHPFSKLRVKKDTKKYGRLTGPPHIIIGKYVRGYGLGLYQTFRNLFKK